MLLQKILGPKSGRENILKNDKSKKKQILNRESVADKDSRQVSMAITSCTSGLNSLSLADIQQKLPWNKQHHTRRLEKQDLVEISEEYDIQSVISGLTRNSQFDDPQDPPQITYEQGIILDRSSEWPDDETAGQHSVRITVTSGNKMESEDIIRSNEGERGTKFVSKSIVSPEPDGRRLPPPVEENLSSSHLLNASKLYEAGFCPVYGSPASAEPDGVKFGSVKSKVPVDPSGHIPSRKSSTKSYAPVLIVHDEKKVRSEKPQFTSHSVPKRRPLERSKSATTTRVRRNRAPTENGKERNKEMSKEDNCNTIQCHKEEKKTRSRSLPRTLGRHKNGHKESEKTNFKEQLSSLCKTQTWDNFKSKGRRNSKKSLSNLLRDKVVGILEDEIVSSLGSQCEGCESPGLEQVGVEKVTTNDVTRQHSSPQTGTEKSEARVCVAFLSQPSTYQRVPGAPEMASHERRDDNDPNCSFGDIRDEGIGLDKWTNAWSTRSEHYQNKDPPEILPPKRHNKPQKLRRPQARAVAEKASKNSILGQDDEEDSVDDFEKNMPFPISSVNPPATLATKDSPITSRSIQTCDKNSEPEITDVAEKSPLSLTPAGRRLLIQRYLTLRDKELRMNSVPSSSASSCGDRQDRERPNMSSLSRIQKPTPRNNTSGFTSFKESEKMIAGYDDASDIYSHVAPVVSPTSIAIDFASSNSSNAKESGNANRSESYQSGKRRFEKLTTESCDCRDDIDISHRTEIDTEAQRTNHVHYFDDESSTESDDFERDPESDSPNKYSRLSPWTCENGLNPHNQFLKMQLGI